MKKEQIRMNKWQTEAVCSGIHWLLKGWLMTCAAALGAAERKPSLPLPRSDDTSQLAAGTYFSADTAPDTDCGGKAL